MDHAVEGGLSQVETGGHFGISSIVVEADVILDTISLECGGYAARSVESGLDATRPDPGGYEVDQNDCVEPSSTTPSSAEMCRGYIAGYEKSVHGAVDKCGGGDTESGYHHSWRGT